MITFHSKALGFYIESNQGEKELITGKTEREHIKVNVSTKFRKVIQGNRVGVSQVKTFCGWQQYGWQRLMLIKIEMRDLMIASHKCSIFLSQHEGSIFLMKDIWIDNKSLIPYTSYLILMVPTPVGFCGL